jgi:hypothetical protein
MKQDAPMNAIWGAELSNFDKVLVKGLLFIFDSS